MYLFQRALKLIRPRGSARKRPARTTAKRLRFESLENRQVLSTAPFTIINNSVGNSAGALAFQDDQIQIAIYAQDFSSTTPPYYYFDSSGNAHLTSTAPSVNGVKLVPTFKLSDLTKTGDHSYTINLPEQLPVGALNGINSARVYVSMNTGINLTINPDSVGSVNALTPNNSFFDFFEFSLNAPNNPVGNLNIDTTNVDQFGFPIKIKLDSTDPNNPADGVGINVTRASVISQFQAFTSQAGDPFAVCIWPTSDPTYGPYRILNPSGILNQGNPAINLLQVQTTLQLAIGASNTTINVYTGAAFPDPSSPFTIQIGSELLTVTGATTNPTNNTTNWTVLRGQGGSTAASHSASSFVTVPSPAMSASQTTLTVVGTTGFPTTYPFRIRVDAEDMLVTSLKSQNLDGTTTWSVVRGQDGTAAAAHNEHAPVYYNAVTALPFNNYFNAAIDALFTKYTNPATPADKLTLFSNADGTSRTYDGEVLPNSQGAYVLRLTSAADPNSINYDVYYPFFKDNAYFWGGYTPALTPNDAPPSEIEANVAGMSPSAMVFSCNGVFADNTFRTTEYTATQQKVLADLENQVVSALNRGVALLPGYASNPAGTWMDASQYYTNNTTGQAWNRYAEFLHKSTVSIDGKNYGFAFDDQNGHASDIGVASFNSVTVTLGPWVQASPAPTPAPTGISMRSFMASNLPLQQSIPSNSSGNARLPSVVASHSLSVGAQLGPAATETPKRLTLARSASQQQTQRLVSAKPASVSTFTIGAFSAKSLLSSRPRR